MVVCRVVTLLSERAGASRLKTPEERTDDLAFKWKSRILRPVLFAFAAFDKAFVDKLLFNSESQFATIRLARYTVL